MQVVSGSVDREPTELWWPFGGLAFCLADESVQPFLDGAKKSLYGVWRAFCFQLDPAIRQILNPTRNLKFLRDMKRGVTKTNSLDSAGKNYRFVMNFRHSVE